MILTINQTLTFDIWPAMIMHLSHQVNNMLKNFLWVTELFFWPERPFMLIFSVEKLLSQLFRLHLNSAVDTFSSAEVVWKQTGDIGLVYSLDSSFYRTRDKETIKAKNLQNK